MGFASASRLRKLPHDHRGEDPERRAINCIQRIVITSQHSRGSDAQCNQHQHRTRNAIHAMQAQLLARSGINLAEAMFSRIGARLVLLGRSAPPDAGQWEAKSDDPSTPPELRGFCQA